MSSTAVFETFFRKLPAGRSTSWLPASPDVLDFLEAFGFDEDDLQYLRGSGMFSGEFLQWLSGVKFTGDVWAVPEGTVVFPNEPIVQVIAPIIEAQLVETFVLNQIHLQSVIASKAARVDAARGRIVVDFGARRAHGTDAALKVGRTSYLAGAAGTSNVLAAQRYGIPTFGTVHKRVADKDAVIDPPKHLLTPGVYDLAAGELGPPSAVVLHQLVGHVEGGRVFCDDKFGAHAEPVDGAVIVQQSRDSVLVEADPAS